MKTKQEVFTVLVDYDDDGEPLNSVVETGGRRKQIQPRMFFATARLRILARGCNQGSACVQGYKGARLRFADGRLSLDYHGIHGHLAAAALSSEYRTWQLREREREAAKTARDVEWPDPALIQRYQQKSGE